MKRFINRYAAGAVIAMAILTLPAALSAQSIWMDGSGDKTLWVEILKPNFHVPVGEKDNSSFLTSAAFLSVRYPLGKMVRVVGELPFAHGGVKSQPGESAIGNPYLGAELGSSNSLFSGEMGVRPPVVGEPELAKDWLPLATGLVTDFDRFEAFFPNLFSVTGMANLRYRDPNGPVVRVRLGPVLDIPTKGDGEAVLFAGYSAQAGYEANRISALAGITGRARLTQEGDLGERTVHQLGLAVSYVFGKVRPGIHFRLPLDKDLHEAIDSVVGLTLGCTL